MTAQTWIDAGNAETDIDIEELETRFGKRPSNDWEGVCEWVYEKLTGNKMQPCTFRGRGFRSRYFGEQVAKIWNTPSTPAQNIGPISLCQSPGHPTDDGISDQHGEWLGAVRKDAAAEIVQRFNSHDKLREALQRLIQWADALESEAAGTAGRVKQGPPIVAAIAALKESDPQ